MTQTEQIIMVNNMLGEPSDDNIVLTYLHLAGQAIINRCYQFVDIGCEVPNKYKAKQCEIAVYLINKRGAEGETAHNENGINRSYESADIPETMLKDIRPYARLI